MEFLSKVMRSQGLTWKENSLQHLRRVTERREDRRAEITLQRNDIDQNQVPLDHFHAIDTDIDTQNRCPNQGHLEDHADTGDLKAGLDQGHLKDHTNTGDLEASLNQAHLKGHTDTGDLEAGPDQGHFKDCIDTGDLEAGLNQGHLKGRTDTGDLEASLRQGHHEDHIEKDDLEAGPDHVHLKNHTDMADPDQVLGIGFTIPETATLYIIQGGGTPTIIHLRGIIPLGGASGEEVTIDPGVDPGVGPGEMPQNLM